MENSKNTSTNWYVYIVQCNDNTLYTGIAKNLEERIKTHNEGKGAKYTKVRLPVSLVYFEPQKNRSEASKKEAEIKKMSRKQKLEVICKSYK